MKCLVLLAPEPTRQSLVDCLAAEEVEQLITYPIEAVMYTLPHVEEVRSISKTGLSVITVVFKEGTDIYFARQLVFERLQAARTPEERSLLMLRELLESLSPALRRAAWAAACAASGRSRSNSTRAFQ